MNDASLASTLFDAAASKSGAELDSRLLLLLLLWSVSTIFQTHNWESLHYRSTTATEACENSVIYTPALGPCSLPLSPPPSLHFFAIPVPNVKDTNFIEYVRMFGYCNYWITW